MQKNLKGKLKLSQKPKRPKRPRQDAQIFYVCNLPLFQTKYRNLDPSQKCRLLYAAWKKIPESEKKPYKEFAKQDKIRFEKEWEIYENKMQKFGIQVEKPNTIPQKGRPPFLMFVSEKYEKIAKKYMDHPYHMILLAKIFGKEWNQLSKEEKQKYKQLSLEEQKLFLKNKNENQIEIENKNENQIEIENKNENQIQIENKNENQN
ncbi:high mobility group protein dsp1 [Anaeramoeba ignava]|uniref:High mobility group protein dsp1 n=1 Tax=Anaeramoeba ignava TaxID=1746090 RepID=A0A9Q0R9B2_ANAIG|nr:high mobility group protein dsp1 [Anaeramoeba ignava]